VHFAREGPERSICLLRRARQVITKVATDQLLFTPVGVSLFYATLTTLEGRPEETPQVRRCTFE